MRDQDKPAQDGGEAEITHQRPPVRGATRELKARLEVALHAEIETAARAAGRSLNAEFNARLARTVEQDDLRRIIREELARSRTNPRTVVNVNDNDLICGG